MFSKDSKSSATPATSATANGGDRPAGFNGDSATNGSATNGSSTKASGVPSIISPDLKIIGDLKSGGDIQIDGTIEGDINSRLLTIGERAIVEGSIVTDTVRISGTVKGQIKARIVHLDKVARVIGDVTHETLTMEAGASLEGQVKRMEPARTTAATKAAPVRPAVSAKGSEPSYGGAESATASLAS
jgi:cytoskeletal protein CcmA (bactofilin family)